MRRLLEAFPAVDAEGRAYEVAVYAETRNVPGGTELVGTAIARVIGTQLELPAVRVNGDVFQLVPGGLQLVRAGMF
ncbi:MAG TPA: hypothetical protein VHR66_16210 [Gemmataceae bacterium]|jgi:hypothetical protein|nr:hypothetical protein [Gemmataceae bacterium]